MKKSIIINIISWLGISLLLFFYLERQLAFHYFYIEQFRLFRFNQDYALQLFSHPGGISEYIASFLIQYFIHPHIGPLIMTCLFLCIGIGVQNIWRKLSPNLEMPLAYLMPGILLLLADMDFNHHLEGILAYASVVWILNLYIRIRSPLFGFHSWPSPHGCCSTLQVRHSKQSYSVLFSMNSTLNHLSNGTPSYYFLWVFFPLVGGIRQDWEEKRALYSRLMLISIPDWHCNLSFIMHGAHYYSYSY